GTAICAATAPCRTRASALASSARSRTLRACPTSATRSPFRERQAMRAIKNWSLTPIFLLLVACGGGEAVKMYEGDEKGVTEVATVRLWSQDLGVIAVDGKPTPSGGRATHVFVDPGEHEFTLAHV